MTSKEALDKLPKLMLAKDIRCLKDISNCFNIIFENLEVLDLLKKYLVDLEIIRLAKSYEEYKDYERFSSNIMPEEEYSKVKVWLENEE